MFAARIDTVGNVTPDEANKTRGRLARWKNRRVLITVVKWSQPKTQPQLGYYFGPVLDAWSDYTGYDEDEMHRELKRAYLAPRLAISRLTGEERQELPSLADLTQEEMSAYLDRCLREGRQLGIVFPDPSERLLA